MAIWPMDGVVSPPLSALRAAALFTGLLAPVAMAQAQPPMAQAQPPAVQAPASQPSASRLPKFRAPLVHAPAAQSPRFALNSHGPRDPLADTILLPRDSAAVAAPWIRLAGSRPPMQDLTDDSIAARFAREADEEELYLLAPPQWDAAADWYQPHRSLAASAFQEIEAEPLKHHIVQPGSFWQRWRERRLEIRRQPGTWMRYPFYFEKFTGLAHLDEPVHGQIKNGQGNLFGGRLGWDFARYAGIETRLGYVRATLNDTLHPLIPSHENFVFWDANLLIYPWGDRRWRPFGMLGLGLVNVGFIDDVGRLWNQTLVTLPVAVGVKYRVNNLTALRFDVTDNIVFGTAQGGNGRHTMSNFAVFFAYERRFGRPHRSYFSHGDLSRWSRLRNWFSSMHY